MSPEHNEAVRAFVRRIAIADFNNNVTAFASTLGVAQSLLSELLKGSRGAGPKLLVALADYACVSLDEVIGRTVPRRRSGATPWAAAMQWVRFRDLPGWDEAEAVALVQFADEIPEYAFRLAGDVLTQTRPARINLYTVREFAAAWQRSTPEETRSAAFRAQVEADIERDEQGQGGQKKSPPPKPPLFPGGSGDDPKV